VHRLGRVVLVVATLSLGVVLAPTVSGIATADAAGCPSALPTRLEGPLFGYPDNRHLDALVGLDLRNSAGKQVNYDGSPFVGPQTYSVVDVVNPSLPADGSSSAGVASWGTDTGSVVHNTNPPSANPRQGQPICVAASVVMVHIEMYPRNATAPYGGDGRTNKVRYGEASHYRQSVTVGADNQIGLRLPVRHELGGNTGGVNGYISLNGASVEPSGIAAIRVWARDGGSSCGVQGFAASADDVRVSTATQTYYLVQELAGGQCNAPSQSYRLDITLVGHPTQSKYVEISNGAVVGAVNFHF
jgi:hypothetical protein